MASVTMLRCEECGALTEANDKPTGWISINGSRDSLIEIEFEVEEGLSFTTTGRLDFCNMDCFSEWLHDLPLTE